MKQQTLEYPDPLQKTQRVCKSTRVELPRTTAVPSLQKGLVFIWVCEKQPCFILPQTMRGRHPEVRKEL